jgi:antirestriction protein
MGDPITSQNLKPRVYLACLAAYNNGILHGAWVDATGGAWALYDAARSMLAASPVAGAEEWAIHDYEGFGGIRIGEYAGFREVADLAAFIVEHGAIGAALLDHFSGDLAEAREAKEARYLGEHTSLADYVQEVTEYGGTVPHNLRYYIDWQAMARDAELNGELFAISTAWGAVHVFMGA